MATSLVVLASQASAGSSGLPLHPLIVHAATVLVPLSLIGLVVAVAVPRLRPRLAGLSVLALAVGTASAWFAEESGETLAERVGVAQDHARYGAWVPVASVAALLVAAAWWRLQRGPSRPELPSWAPRVAAGAVVVTAVLTTAVTVAAGHSGAVSVWESKGQVATGATTPLTGGSGSTGATASPGTTGSAGASGSPGTSSAGGGGGRTLAEVAKHNTRTDCWSVIEGKVYNLTAWVAQHPGGAGTIVGMCGVDATAAFRGKHGASPGPVGALAGFVLGPLSAGGPAVPAPTATAAAAPTTRYSGAEVAKHASASSCWSVVEGKVYDLTMWVSRHPGGQGAITEMCGTNGAGEYLEQHAGDAAARQVLTGYQIGVLG